MSYKVSKNGVRRERRGQIQRLNSETRAYAPIVAAHARAYDGHNGKTAHVMIPNGMGKVTAPMLQGNDENAVADLLSPKLPNFGHNFTE